MNLNEIPAIRAAYEAAVVCLLNACPDATPEQAEEVVESITTLVLATLQAHLSEETHEPASH